MHASKILLKIIQKRLEPYLEREIPDEQGGFRKNRGTRDQIANIRRLMETTREYQKNIYMCFIDYSKAFDCVDHQALLNCLRKMGIPEHLIILLRGLYTDQEATVRTMYGNTEWFKINKGVRQGCILSPYLFNLYSENIMRMAGLEEIEHGIKIGGRNINNLRYADDTTLLAETEEGLKMLLDRVKQESEKAGLRLNIKKTKVMVTSSELEEFMIRDETVEVVDSFIFLGAKIEKDGGCRSEIIRRIAKGKAAMTGLHRVMKDKEISMRTKVRLVKALVFPVMMYGCESWTIRKSERRKIDAFELWCWRRILRIPWTARRTNKSVLKEIKPEISLEGMIAKQALTFFGHTIRASGMEKDIMLGRVEGTRRRGRQRTRWLDVLKEFTGMSLHQLNQTAMNRSEWRSFVQRIARSCKRLNCA